MSHHDQGTFGHVSHRGSFRCGHARVFGVVPIVRMAVRTPGTEEGEASDTVGTAARAPAAPVLPRLVLTLVQAPPWP
ncbi:hypothetical protein GCM10007147_03500 [Nocardiopsis kunsanensis]|uniref:Uncharacterized protein n=1 Tax=Nocardiopsis kunsanensis TaxID=141693 RepID=A0A919CES0_9ACTN|nr:hypothetical protein GCM10007147_03500 [Nocardiopsis kunsanensis]